MWRPLVTRSRPGPSSARGPAPRKKKDSLRGHLTLCNDSAGAPKPNPHFLGIVPGQHEIQPFFRCKRIKEEVQINSQPLGLQARAQGVPPRRALRCGLAALREQPSELGPGSQGAAGQMHAELSSVAPTDMKESSDAVRSPNQDWECARMRTQVEMASQNHWSHWRHCERPVASLCCARLFDSDCSCEIGHCFPNMSKL